MTKPLPRRPFVTPGAVLATVCLLFAGSAGEALATTGGPTQVVPFCIAKDGALYAVESRGDESGDGPSWVRVGRNGERTVVAPVEGRSFGDDAPSKLPAGCARLEGPVDLTGLKLEFEAVSASAPRLEACTPTGHCLSDLQVHYAVVEHFELRRPGGRPFTFDVPVCAGSIGEPAHLDLYRRHGTGEVVALLSLVSDCSEGGYRVDTMHFLGAIRGVREASVDFSPSASFTLSADLIQVNVDQELLLLHAAEAAERAGNLSAAAEYLESWFNAATPRPGEPRDLADLSLHLAVLYSKTKQPDASLRALARALSWRQAAPSTLAQAQKLRAFDPLRNDPRFTKLLDPKRCCDVVEVRTAQATRLERRLAFEEGVPRESSRQWVQGELASSRDERGAQLCFPSALTPSLKLRAHRCVLTPPAPDEWNVALTPTGPMVDGKREGTWKLVAADGSVANETTYAGGVPDGPQRFYYRQGGVRIERVLRNGWVEGAELQRYPTGGKQSEVKYSNGVQVPGESCWFPNGAPQVEYDASSKVSRSFDASGRLFRVEVGSSFSCTLEKPGQACSEVHGDAAPEVLAAAGLQRCDNGATQPVALPCPARAVPAQLTNEHRVPLSLHLLFDLGTASSYGVGLRLGERVLSPRTDLSVGYSVGPSARLFTLSHDQVDGQFTSVQGDFAVLTAWSGLSVEAEAGYASGGEQHFGAAGLGVLLHLWWFKVGYAFQFPLFAARPAWFSSHQLCIRFSAEAPLWTWQVPAKR